MDLKIHSGNWASELEALRQKQDIRKLFFVVDQNLKPYLRLPGGASIHWVQALERHKSLVVCEQIWQSMAAADLDRKSWIINIGGGLTTDIGAFAASTYMRGLPHVNVPTSVLGMVDAAVGGKTGINFQGYKNRIGTFQEAAAVLLDTTLLKSLPEEEWWSGYAEAIKHALIASSSLWQRFQQIRDLSDVQKGLPEWILEVVTLKQSIVEADFREQGERKKLNFGHTVGHALESFFIHQGVEVPHGYAVAAGMWVETEIAMLSGLLEASEGQKIQQKINEWYEPLPFGKEDIADLTEWMKGDKKNEQSGLNFTLLTKAGRSIINQYPAIKTIEQALESYVKGAKKA
jgi:3-dehydroquinate synthase